MPPVEHVRRPFEAFFATHASLRLALATGPREQASPLERAAATARAALGTGETRELLDEALHAERIDAASHAALLAHLAEAAEAEVLARRSLPLGLDPDTRAPIAVEGRERTLLEIASELREHGRKDEPAKLRALSARLDADREARREALAEAEERTLRILARGARGLDESPDDTRERCEAFLHETHDVAHELADRVRHPAGAEGRGLLGLLRALSPLSLDPLVPAKGRARRLGSVLEALGLGRELSQALQLASSPRLALAPLAVSRGNVTTVVTSALELGVASERAFIGAIVSALAASLRSPALPLEHRHAPLGTATLTLGALFEGALAEAPLSSALHHAGSRADAQLRTCMAASSLVAARVACTRALAIDRSARGDDEARDRMAIALGCDPGEVPVELALPLRRSPRKDVAEARARLAAFALVPALRERYDADFYRNPRFADFLRGAAARGGTVSAEGLVADAGGTLADACRHARELVG